MIEAYNFANGKLLRDVDAKDLLIFTSPNEEEQKILIETYKIDPHNLASSLDPDELGRLEIEDGKIAIIIKQPCNFSSSDQLLFTVSSMGLFLHSKSLIIVTTEKFQLPPDGPRKIQNARDALLKILAAIIGHFLGHLKVINMLSESLEKRVSASMGNKHLLSMFTLEKSLVYFVNGLSSNLIVLEKLASSKNKFRFTPAQQDILADLIIENMQLSKQAEIYSNILTGLMDARGSVVNNNLSLLIKKLTILSVIFMPMNVIAGMFGMSELSAMTKGIPYWITYPLFFVAMIGVGFLTYFILKKNGVDPKIEGDMDDK